ncbi:unnamed protein product [Rotaria sordida]|uniref:Kynureninase n=1 Tax=Rotaria sordida TaxID=392033 RepID=A0A818K3S9_9BILA|nr:unnamed protein product [Rotaria sordida]CAF0814682.1 unnamed protein product [Rotaria sordida]CAF3553244.1 unnamed protein product [Rotaria sordida]CAF3809698.1 unnamed protein product [Rotaria sordida]
MNNDFHGPGQQSSPQDILNHLSKKWNVSITSEEFARKLDEKDSLRNLRDEFYLPKLGSLPKVDKSRTDLQSDCIYLCGHSLGLQPKRVRKFIDTWLNDWADLGVYGHTYGTNPFAYCDYPCIPTLKKLLGAEDNEVGVMNQLTTNIHFMMVSFYRPTSERFKILYEERAFPSDEYAFRSQIRYHGYKTEEAVLTIKSRENEDYIRTEDILELLEQQGQSIALVFLSGVQYFTGQLFDIETITRTAQQYGCVVGWDLAHAVGNIPLKLHDWNVDFATFCSYKYLNSGAGCVGGIFVHSNHFNKEYPKFDGWWGNQDETRFQMNTEIVRGLGANGFRISNPSIHQCATLAASLQVFEEAGIENLRTKSKLLTQYLEYLIEHEMNPSSTHFKIDILTPTDPEQRGAQLSFRIIGVDVRQLFTELERSGVCLDVRGNVIRVAPIPLYNSFMDVYRFVLLLQTIKF